MKSFFCQSLRSCWCWAAFCRWLPTGSHAPCSVGQSPHLLPYLRLQHLRSRQVAVPSADAETFLVEDQATGQVLELSRQEYVLGAVAAEMPVSWPDEALKHRPLPPTATRSTAGITPPCKAAPGSLPTQPGGRAA